MQSFREQKVIIFYLSNKRAKENGFKAVKISDISKEAFPNYRKRLNMGMKEGWASILSLLLELPAFPAQGIK